MAFGFLFIQVGRRSRPEEDAAVVQAVRLRVGTYVQIRADANRKWSYQQAIEFANLVRDYDLQYLEVLNQTLVENVLVVAVHDRHISTKFCSIISLSHLFFAGRKCMCSM